MSDAAVHTRQTAEPGLQTAACGKRDRWPQAARLSVHPPASGRFSLADRCIKGKTPRNEANRTTAGWAAGHHFRKTTTPESSVDGLQGGQQADSQHQEVEGKDWGLRQPQEQVLTGRLKTLLAQKEVGDKVTNREGKKAAIRLHGMGF